MDKQPSAAALKAADEFRSDPDNTYMVYGSAMIETEALALAFDAYAAERERAARQTALEEACKAVCGRCNRGVKAELRKGVYMHWVRDGLEPKGTEGRWGTCAASAIRALMGEEVTP